MFRRSGWLAGVIAVAAGLGGCGGADDGAAVPLMDTANDVPVPVAGRAAAEANWISRPTTLKEAAQKSDAGGVLTVEAVEPSEPIVAAEDEVNPTTMVTMRVRDRWFGTLEPTARPVIEGPIADTVKGEAQEGGQGGSAMTRLMKALSAVITAVAITAPPPTSARPATISSRR